MNKVYIVVVLACFTLSLSAQNLSKGIFSSQIKTLTAIEETLVARQNRIFSEKLDSITLSYGSKIIFYYNETLEVARTSTVMPGVSGPLVLNRDYTFDQFGNVTCLIESGDSENRKSLYYYSDDGIYIVSKMVYKIKDGDWVLDEKVEYFQSEDESYGYAVKSEIEENGDWRNDEKVEYYFEDSKVMTEYKSNWDDGYNEWKTALKCEHTYDVDGNHISSTDFYKIGNEVDGYDWIPDEQKVYEYDDNGNCVMVRELEYDSDLGIWELTSTTTLFYNLSQEWENIAGFGIYEMNQPFNMRNKLLYMSISTEDMTFEATFHYSAATSVRELQGRNLVVWPNPCGQTLHIQSEDIESVRIYSVDGRLLKTLDDGDKPVNVGDLARGCYMLKVSFEGGEAAVCKFLKR